MSIFIEACMLKTKVKELKKSLHSAQVNTLIKLPFIKRKEYVNFLAIDFVKRLVPLTLEGRRARKNLPDAHIFEAAKTFEADASLPYSSLTQKDDRRSVIIAHSISMARKCK